MDNFFENFFNESFGSTERTFEQRLTSYWQSGKFNNYYELLIEVKKTYKVFRNSDGEHKLMYKD